MQNLAKLAEQVKDKYSNLHSYVVSTKNIRITEAGYLSTGKNEFPITLDGLDQFAGSANIPKQFLRKLPTDLRAMVFNKCFEIVIGDGKLPRDIQVNLNKDMQVIGFDDPKLLRVSPVKLMDTVCSSLPEGLSPEQIAVSRFSSISKRLEFSCFSPKIITEPRPDDIINGGVDVIHHLVGDFGTQIHCYLRRLVCRNGAIAHVCSENRQLRARRLRNGRFDEADMLKQIRRLLTEAWTQLQEKLDAVKGLLQKERMSMDFLRQQRTKFSLNNRILAAIEQAMGKDKLESTESQYDLFNAISRVATHADLTFRQRRTLSRMAGEFSQQTAHQCSQCGQCGQWVVSLN